MESSTASFKDDEKRDAAHAIRGTGYPPDGYRPPPHDGGFPPARYAPPQPVVGYGGYQSPSPPPPYGAFPPPYNTGYNYPYYNQHPPPVPSGYGYPPTPIHPSHGYNGNPAVAANGKKKDKKKSGMSKILGLGAGLVGGLLLGDLVSESGVAVPSFESFSDHSSGSSFNELYDSSIQSSSDSMDMLGSIG